MTTPKSGKDNASIPLDECLAHSVSNRRKSIAAAKSEFVSAVSKALCGLKEQRGFSHERATAVVLREIRREDSPPTEDEVFHFMKLYGIGVEEARKALTVSRAVQRVKSERRVSAVDAIDDLTSHLRLSRLLETDASDGLLGDDGISCSISCDKQLEERIFQREEEQADSLKVKSFKRGNAVLGTKKSMTSKEMKSKCTEEEKVSKITAAQLPTISQPGNVRSRTPAAEEVLVKEAELSKADGRPSEPNTPNKPNTPVGTRVAKRPFLDNEIAKAPPMKRARADSV